MLLFRNTAIKRTYILRRTNSRPGQEIVPAKEAHNRKGTIMDLTKTISLTDYRMIKPTLARVIISTTGNLTKTEMADMLCAKLSYLAAPVEDSFRKLTKNTAIGFIRANRQIREYNKGIEARYKIMSSNILMDKQDRTLWEIKSGPGGSYISRQGNEDLSELVEASTVSRSDAPRLAHVTMAKAAPAEFAAFCTDTGAMDYGFVTRSNDKFAEIVSASLAEKIVVKNEMIASLSPVTIDRQVHNQILAKLNSEQKKKAADYWQALFSFAPEYAEQLVDAVNEDAMM